VRPRISEFSYGFALTRELIAKKWSGLELVAAPFLPSLPAEGQPGGGFDVKLQGIKALVFLQFKVSHYMTRSTAKGVSTGHLTVPYYRFDVHAPKSSDQHRLLLQLEQTQNDPPHIVRYVAPAFFTEAQFNSAYFSDTVSIQSIFVAPSQIVLPTTGPHSVGFESPKHTAVVLSEPKEMLGKIDFVTFEASVAVVRDRTAIPIDAPQIGNLREAMIQITRDVGPVAKPERLFGELSWVRADQVPRAESFPIVDEQRLRSMRPIDAVGNVAWTHLGCQTIALG
jgi:hypothetical protein